MEVHSPREESGPAAKGNGRRGDSQRASRLKASHVALKGMDCLRVRGSENETGEGTEDYRLGVLTIRTDDEQETLPVFSSGQEAQIFLRFGGVTGGWRARRSSARELVSLLPGPRAGVKKVALDPSPEVVVEGTVGLVSFLRESSMNLDFSRSRSSFQPSTRALWRTTSRPSGAPWPGILVGMAVVTNLLKSTHRAKDKGDVRR